MEIPVHCTLCPRRCGADRTRARGACGGGGKVKVAKAALHFWEEPCISGTCGSGTVFFSGCALRCCYCQNHAVSAGNFGKEISVERLAEIFLSLQAQGAHNLNLVTAGHYLPWVCEALRLAGDRLRIPVVYNTGGYETEEAVAALRGFVDIWLTDLKYRSPALAAEYSDAPDYFDVASAALRAMLAQAGPPMYDADGNRTYDHYTDHENIYEWAFNTFSYEKILSVTDEITEVPVKLGDGAEHVILVPSEDFYTLWPNTLDKSSLKKEIVTKGYLDADESVTAPVDKGRVLGKYTLSLSGETLCSVDLVAKNDVALSQLEYNIMKVKAFVGSFWFKAAVAAAVLLTAAYITVYILATKKRRMKMKKVSQKGKRRL